MNLGVTNHEHGEQHAHQQLPTGLGAFGQTQVPGSFDLEPIVEESDDSTPDDGPHHHKARPRIDAAIQVRYDVTRESSADDSNATHRRGTCLGEMRLGPFFADVLADAAPRQGSDEQTCAQQGHHQGHRRRDEQADHWATCT